MESRPHIFFPKPLSTFSLLLSPSETEKQPNIFSKPGGEAPSYCGFKSLLNHGAAAPSLLFFQWIFLWHLTPLAGGTAGRLEAGTVATCPRYTERGHILLCPKESKKGLKVCHGWGYGAVLPWTSLCLLWTTTRNAIPRVRNALCKSANSAENLFCTPNFQPTLSWPCMIPHCQPWCQLLIRSATRQKDFIWVTIWMA